MTEKLDDYRERVTFTERVWLSDAGFFIRENDHLRITGGQTNHLFTEPIYLKLTPWEHFPERLDTRCRWQHRSYSPHVVKGEYEISLLEKEDFRGNWAMVEEQMVDRQIAGVLGTTPNKRRFRESEQPLVNRSELP